MKKLKKSFLLVLFVSPLQLRVAAFMLPYLPVWMRGGWIGGFVCVIGPSVLVE